jgi:hypothetical protein
MHFSPVLILKPYWISDNFTFSQEHSIFGPVSSFEKAERSAPREDACERSTKGASDIT